MEDYIDDLYLLFLGGGSYFLLPLCYVKQVRERTAEQTTTKEFNFSRRLHKDGPIERYQVVLGLDGKELCLAAEDVYKRQVISNDPAACGIYHPQKGTINVSGGIIQGSTGLQMCSGNLSVVNMNGGSIIGTGEDEREGKTGDGAVSDLSLIHILSII